MPRSRSTSIRTPSATACAASWSTARRVLTVARAGALHPLDGSLAAAARRRARAPARGGRPRAGRAPRSTAPATLLAPVDEQEVWASGVTYRRSATARVEESSVGDVYELVYEAQRPELFLKAPAARVPAPGAPLRIRADSTWDVPEPELALVLDADGADRGLPGGRRRLLALDRGRQPALPAAGQGLRRLARAVGDDRPGPRRRRPARRRRSSSRSTATASGSSPARRRSAR